MVSLTAKKILLVRFSALGDVIQTLPVLTMLREGFPDAVLGWAIDAELVPAIEGHPALNHIHPCARKRWMQDLAHPSRWSAAWQEMQAFVDSVRRVDYDVAVDAQGLFKTALLPYFAGIKKRIGYSHGRELSSFFYTQRYLNLKEYFEPSVFHLEHMALLAKAIGAADVRYGVQPPVVPAAAHQKVTTLLQGAFSQTAPLVAMAPATQWPSKHWPEEHWVKLIYRLLLETDLNLALVGSPGDASVVARIISAFPNGHLNGRVVNLAGKTSIQEMYALYQRVQAAVGSDSAPLHIAGAAGVPVLIGIYGPTGYRRTPPIGSPHIRLLSTEGQLDCQPCHKRVCPLGTTECMSRVKPAEVFDALLQVLAQAGISSHQSPSRHLNASTT